MSIIYHINLGYKLQQEGRGENDTSVQNQCVAVIVLTSLVVATLLVIAARYEISRTSLVCCVCGWGECVWVG